MTPPEKSFVFAPMHNMRPKENEPPQNDAIGAFHPGMSIYKKMYEGMGKQVVTFKFDNYAPAKQRRQSILDKMQQGAGSQWYDAIIYFGHGWKGGLASAGFDNASRGDLTDAIWYYGQPWVKVVLFACSCATPGGYAYKMAQDLNCWANEGMEVLGHPSVGHSFTNPQVRRYPSNQGETGETVCPDGRVQGWLKKMRDERAGFWAQMPFMTREELAAAV
ncbi:hypothetical protein GXW71_32415 [Roseomonas hellenica]|uniref:Uncharacterized protein n=1 Tax=Plastoroseomonas hellenica TaxID=2687306 RepID=A0ABS5F958_9PROT|nr:hypothetical protein [Plastoroseomonas hellenica]MBR0669099.1 hypothetical protein [Plastoroseomonas hellenica]